MRQSIPSTTNKKGESKIVVVTAYDACSAKLVDGIVDMILVGDSLGMVVQGNENTIPVTLDEMIYHTKMVVRGSEHSVIAVDLPFLTYQTSVTDAIYSSGRCLKEGGAQAVKLEGGFSVAPQIKGIVDAGIPVIGHLGLTPQSVHIFGGYGKQAKSEAEANKLVEDALAIQDAGVCMIVLENIPHDLAEKVSKLLKIPTIGIGAGGGCDGQVQVFHDLFGLYPDFMPRHAVRYAQCGSEIREAVQKYRDDVRSGEFISK